MEKRMKVLLSGAGVAAVGLALILGNGLLSLTAFAETEYPTSQSEMRSVELSDVALPDDAEDDPAATMGYANGEDGKEVLLKTTVGEGEDNPVFVEGQPGEGDMSKQAASDAAIDTVVQKYALTAETLDRFTVIAKLNVVDPANPEWQVVFTPTDNNDFSTIGSYMVTLNSQTGEVLETMSAADAVG